MTDAYTPVKNDPVYRELLKRIGALYRVGPFAGEQSNSRLYLAPSAATLLSDDAAKRVHALPEINYILADFSYVPQPSDADLVPTQVEPLIDQAASLLDRALVDRAAYQNLAIDALNIALEISEFLDLDEIHAKELTAIKPPIGTEPGEGVDTLPWTEAQQSAAAELKYHDAQKKAGNFLTSIVSLFKDGLDKFVRIAGEQAENAAIPYSGTAAGPAFSRQYTDKGSAPAQIHAGFFAREQARLNYDVMLKQAEASNAATVAQIDASEERQISLKKRKVYAMADVEFRAQKYAIAKAVILRKCDEAMKLNGVLNYAGQMLPIMERCKRDVRDAYARLKAVEQGLATVYGMPASIPKDSRETIIDESVSWVRATINDLTTRARLDQNYVLGVSIAALIDRPLPAPHNKRRFSEAVKETVTFVVGEDLFPNQRLIRLRGISAFARDKANEFYALRFQVPRSGVAIYEGTQHGKIDQKKIPWCWLGRVGPKTLGRDPDVTGLVTLHNCSPIGEWKLELSPESKSKAAANGLSDIELHMHLAVRMLWPAGDGRQ